MFRIECFCDDRSLAKLLWALAGLGAYNVTNQPVLDTTKPNGIDKLLNGSGHKPAAPKHAKEAPRQHRGKRIGGDVLVARFLAWAKKKKLRELRAADMRKFVATLGGWSPRSYSYAMSLVRESGNLVRAPGTEGATTKSVWLVRLRRPNKPKSKSAAKSKPTKELIQ